MSRVPLLPVFGWPAAGVGPPTVVVAFDAREVLQWGRQSE